MEKLKKETGKIKEYVIFNKVWGNYPSLKTDLKYEKKQDKMNEIIIYSPDPVLMDSNDYLNSDKKSESRVYQNPFVVYMSKEAKKVWEENKGNRITVVEFLREEIRWMSSDSWHIMAKKFKEITLVMPYETNHPNSFSFKNMVPLGGGSFTKNGAAIHTEFGYYLDSKPQNLTVEKVEIDINEQESLQGMKAVTFVRDYIQFEGKNCWCYIEHPRARGKIHKIYEV